MSSSGGWISRRTIVANSIGSASESSTPSNKDDFSNNRREDDDVDNNIEKAENGERDQHAEQEQEETKEEKFSFGAAREARRRSFYSNLAAAKSDVPKPYQSIAAASRHQGASVVESRGTRTRAVSTPEPAPHLMTTSSAKQSMKHNLTDTTTDENIKPERTRKASSRRLLSLYEDAKRVAEKLANKRTSLDREGCTFKPQITKKAAAQDGPKGRARTDSLYRNAERVRNRILRKRAEPQDECTFSPKLVARKKDRTDYNNNYNNSTNNPSVSKRSFRFSKLYSNASRREAKLEAQRAELPNECTFSPVVNRRRCDAPSPVKVQGASSRLYGGQDYQHKRKKEMKEKQAERELKECSFAPKINAPRRRVRPRPQHKDPSHHKAEEEVLEEKKKADNAEQNLEKQDGLMSAELVLGKGKEQHKPVSKEPIYKRLHRFQANAIQKLQVRLKDKLEAEMAECTFRPLRWHTVRKNQSRETDSLFNRLYNDAFQREERAEKLIYKVTMEETNGFIPNGKRMEDIRYSSERFNDLYERGMEKVMIGLQDWKNPERLHSLSAKREEEALSECFFHPQIHKFPNAYEDDGASGVERFKDLYEDADVIRDKIETVRLNRELEESLIRSRAYNVKSLRVFDRQDRERAQMSPKSRYSGSVWSASESLTGSDVRSRSSALISRRRHTPSSPLGRSRHVRDFGFVEDEEVEGEHVGRESNDFGNGSIDLGNHIPEMTGSGCAEVNDSLDGGDDISEMPGAEYTDDNATVSGGNDISEASRFGDGEVNAFLSLGNHILEMTESRDSEVNGDTNGRQTNVNEESDLMMTTVLEEDVTSSQPYIMSEVGNVGLGSSETAVHQVESVIVDNEGLSYEDDNYSDFDAGTPVDRVQDDEAWEVMSESNLHVDTSFEDNHIGSGNIHIDNHNDNNNDNINDDNNNEFNTEDHIRDDATYDNGFATDETTSNDISVDETQVGGDDLDDMYNDTEQDQMLSSSHDRTSFVQNSVREEEEPQQQHEEEQGEREEQDINSFEQMPMRDEKEDQQEEQEVQQTDTSLQQMSVPEVEEGKIGQQQQQQQHTSLMEEQEQGELHTADLLHLASFDQTSGGDDTTDLANEEETLSDVDSNNSKAQDSLTKSQLFHVNTVSDTNENNGESDDLINECADPDLDLNAQDMLEPVIHDEAAIGASMPIISDEEAKRAKEEKKKRKKRKKKKKKKKEKEARL